MAKTKSRNFRDLANKKIGEDKVNRIRRKEHHGTPKNMSMMNERKCQFCKQQNEACDCMMVFVSAPELKAQRLVLKMADHWERCAPSWSASSTKLANAVRALRKTRS